MFGFYGTIAISLMVLVLQGIKHQSSFTVSTLLLPVIAMMYVMHSNPYDALLGANDITAMQDYVQYCYEKKLSFIFMSLYLREFEEEGTEIPQKVQAGIRQFTDQVVRKARLFKVGKGHMILIFLKKVIQCVLMGRASAWTMQPSSTLLSNMLCSTVSSISKSPPSPCATAFFRTSASATRFPKAMAASRSLYRCRLQSATT